MPKVISPLDLLQVSLLINKQMGGGQNEEERRKGKESETCELCVPETRPVKILTGGFSFMLVEEPIKLEQVNAEPRFQKAWSTSLALLSFSLPFSSSSSLPFAY